MSLSALRFGDLMMPRRSAKWLTIGISTETQRGRLKLSMQLLHSSNFLAAVLGAGPKIDDQHATTKKFWKKNT